MGSISKSLALILIGVMAISSASLLMVKPANAQLATRSSSQVFTHVENENFTLVPESTIMVQIQLEKGDKVNGSFTISNFHFYPNNYIGGHGELITYSTSVQIPESKDQMLYDSGGDREGSFNFTALHSGVYTIFCNCGYIYGVINPNAPQLTMTYEVTGVPMEVNVLSPANQTYKGSNVSLSLTANRFGNWIGYSLDNKGNVTLWDSNDGTPMSYSNMTLTGLTNGRHTITIYANDTYGNMNAQTITFSLSLTNTLALALEVVIVTTVIIVVAFLVFRRRGKNAKSRDDLE